MDAGERNTRPERVIHSVRLSPAGIERLRAEAAARVAEGAEPASATASAVLREAMNLGMNEIERRRAEETRKP